MIIVGVSYIVSEPTNMKEITTVSSYKAYTPAGSDCSRQPTKSELAIARFQEKHVAEIARKLCRLSVHLNVEFQGVLDLLRWQLFSAARYRICLRFG